MTWLRILGVMGALTLSVFLGGLLGMEVFIRSTSGLFDYAIEGGVILGAGLTGWLLWRRFDRLGLSPRWKLFVAVAACVLVGWELGYSLGGLVAGFLVLIAWRLGPRFQHFHTTAQRTLSGAATQPGRAPSCDGGAPSPQRTTPPLLGAVLAGGLIGLVLGDVLANWIWPEVEVRSFSISVDNFEGYVDEFSISDLLEHAEIESKSVTGPDESSERMKNVLRSIGGLVGGLAGSLAWRRSSRSAAAE